MACSHKFITKQLNPKAKNGVECSQCGALWIPFTSDHDWLTEWYEALEFIKLLIKENEKLHALLYHNQIPNAGSSVWNMATDLEHGYGL